MFRETPSFVFRTKSGIALGDDRRLERLLPALTRPNPPDSARERRIDAALRRIRPRAETLVA
jgi:hypothetical protein